MRTYKVTVEHEHEGDAFAGLHDYEPEAVVEFVDFANNGEEEIYTIDTEFDIDLFLDRSPGVIRYEVSEAA